MSFSGFRKPKLQTRPHRKRARPSVEELEQRVMLTATLGWTTGVNLLAPASAVSAIASGSQILLFGNGSTAVQTLDAGATAWTSGGTIDTARSSPGVGYSSGQLLVYGGYSAANGGATDGAIRFSAGVATQITPLNTPREQFAFTSNGTYAFAIGGIDDGGNLLNTVEEYDATVGDWLTLAPLPKALSGAQAVFDGSGSIYVIGGRTSAGVSSAVYQYNIAANTWTAMAPLQVAEASGAAVLGADGKIDVIGGVGTNGNSIATVQRFDLATKTWSVDTSLPTPVSNEGAAVDSLGRIEVIGGENRQGTTVIQSAAVYVSDLAPVFTSMAPANPTVVAGTTFTYTATASATPTATFSLLNPPAGAAIDSATGVFTFSPTLSQTGTVTIDIRAANVYASADQTFTLAVKAPGPTGLAVTGASLTTISLSWNASAGPVAYYRVYMDGQLPQYDIVADKVTGSSATITGLTSQIAGHTFYVTSFDQAGNESLFSAPVVGHTWTAGALQYTSNYGYYLSVPATHTLVIQLSNPGANPAPTSYNIVSGAPAGMTLNSTTGVITWTPTDAQALNGYFPVVSSTNAAGTVTLQLGIAVQLNYPAITANYPGTTGSTAYAGLPFLLQFKDSSGAAVTWKLNSAPTGATLSPTGLVNWTPTLAQALASSSVTFSVTATNYAGSSTYSVSVPLLTLAAPTNLTDTVNKTAGTLLATWGPSTISALPIASYRVTLSYVYYTSSGGRGSHPVPHTGSWTTTVSATTHRALFTGIPFFGLPSYARFTLSVEAFDTAGTGSPLTTLGFYRP